MGTVFGDIRFKRGPEVNLPSLEEGQPAFTKDSKRVFIGSDAGNIELAKKDSVDLLEGRVTSDLIQRSINVKYPFGTNLLALNGDGTDETVNIQAFFTYAKTVGNVNIYFPDGTYCISNYIQVYKNTTVILNPNAVIKRIGTYYKMFVNGDTANKSYVVGGGYSGEGNIHFVGGTFDLNCQVGNTSGISPTQTVTFFDLGHAENISFNNITVKNGQIGHYFQVSSCKNVRFKDCWFGYINYTGDGTNYSYECIQIEVATDESFPDFGIYDLTISRDIYIENCTFDGVIRGIGTHSDGKYGTSNVIFCENIRVKDCVFRNVTDIALNLTGYRYSVFENNLIDTTGGYGFNINVCEDNKIINNTILNTQKAAFNITSSHNNKFAKNKAKEIALDTVSPYAGFRLSASNGNTFDDDTITAVTPNYTYAWYSSGGGIGNRIISHNYTKGKTATIGGADDTEKANIGFGGGQTVLFDGDISALTTPATLTNDIRNFNFLVVMANGNSGSASMTSIIIPKAAILFGVTTSRFRLLTADSSTSAQLDFSFPTTTSIQMDTNPSGTGHIRKVIGII
jgi:hypothetical protein